ncbi:MAG: type II secretion system F family protein [Candidatus Taylorbacteria bacterium]|nr:type II secretion system F family protein [Candidatus Taylorbacteria bacterium]
MADDIKPKKGFWRPGMSVLDYLQKNTAPVKKVTVVEAKDEKKNDLKQRDEKKNGSKEIKNDKTAGAKAVPVFSQSVPPAAKAPALPFFGIVKTGIKLEKPLIKSAIGFWNIFGKKKSGQRKEPKARIAVPQNDAPPAAKSAYSSFLFKKRINARVAPVGVPSKLKQALSKFGTSYGTKELVLFVKRLAFLTKSGVPIMESVQLLRKQTRSRAKGRVLDKIIDDVSNGQFLSDAMDKRREVFGAFAVNVIKVGEMSGTLSQNLLHLSEELHKRHALKKKLIGALIYPAFITVATIGVATLLTVYIFPKVMPIFTSLNVKLPVTTKVLLFISNFLQHYWLYLGFALIALIVGLTVAVKTLPKFNYILAQIVLRLPLFGTLVLHYNIANFCRTFSLLLRSGFGVVETCTIIADSTENPVYKKECLLIREYVTAGEKVSKHMEEVPRLWPDIVRHMTSIGESSGNLSDTFMYLSEHYEAEVDDLIKNLSNSIEPVLMIFMGLVVGFVAVSVITPIYEVTQNLQR